MEKRDGEPPVAEGAGDRIPRFKTVAEEAEFWDTHDSVEFEDQFQDVADVKFVMSQPKKGITVRLEPDTLAVLRRKAREKGIGPSTLVRMWILERLQESA